MRISFLPPSNGRKRFGSTYGVLAFAICLFIFGCKGCNPKQSFIGKVCTWDVPAGQSYTFVDAPGMLSPVEFRARVYHSTLDTNCVKFDSTLHPLVVFGHGRYPLGVPNNYLGMSNLMDHLASWGYICISVNLDVVNSLQNGFEWGIPHRGELMLHAIEYMAKECRTPASPFYHRIDTTKIALIGHSRGGGGAIYACNYNSTHRNRPIKALATISPVNFGTDALTASIPHLSIYGSWDGDLIEGQGPDIWSRGTRTAPKELVEIYGANHFHFTDNITYPFEANEISREQHQQMAKGLINAWFDTHVRAYDRFNWPKYLQGSPRIVNGIDYYLTYYDEHFLSIDNGGPIGTTGVNNLNGNNVGTGLPLFTDFTMSNPPDYSFGPALNVTWDGGTDALTFNFPSTNASGFGFLSFRMSQVHPYEWNPLDTKKDLNVTVADAAGHQGTVPISNYLGGLQYPDVSGSLDAGDMFNFKQIMRGFRIPKTDFVGVDFSQVVSVKFSFNRPNVAGFTNSTGAIKIEDLEFAD
ncbi:MAG: hypothetical protein U0176_07525 [Bacteroidia bacterium]